jgi:beta-lactamase class D
MFSNGTAPKIPGSVQSRPDPAQWLKDSIVWVSQRITPLLGQEKFKAYLEKFHYGNTDISAALPKPG